MSLCQIRRDARNFATSSKKSLWLLKKKLRRGAKSSTRRPRASAASTYAIPSAIVNASSWTAVEHLHVGERAHGDPARPELALCRRVVRVVAVERRHVVRDREAGLPGVEELPETRVRVLRGAEAREHPHRPQPAPVAGRMDAS